MVVLRYDDVPGVIGRVGTLLGEAGVNIANMAVSRNREAGKALMVLSLDSPAEPEVLERLGHGVDEVYVVGAADLERRAAPRAAARSPGQRVELDQVRRGGADQHRALGGVPRFEPTTSRPRLRARPALDLGAEPPRERLGGLGARSCRRPRRPPRSPRSGASARSAKLGRGDRDRERARRRAVARPRSAGTTCPGVVRYAEPNTIASACSFTASSRSPSGVEALCTTNRGTSGSPSQRCAALEQLPRPRARRAARGRRSRGRGGRTRARARRPPSRAASRARARRRRSPYRRTRR